MKNYFANVPTVFVAEDDAAYSARETLDGKGYYIRELDLFLPHELLRGARGAATFYIMIKGGNKEKEYYNAIR